MNKTMRRPAKGSDLIKKNTINKETLIDNLLICGITFDYRDETKNVEEKRQRIKALNFIHKIFNNENLVEKLIQPNIGAIMEMIETNIFRPFEPIQNCTDPDAEAD